MWPDSYSKVTCKGGLNRPSRSPSKRQLLVTITSKEQVTSEIHMKRLSRFQNHTHMHTHNAPWLTWYPNTKSYFLFLKLCPSTSDSSILFCIYIFEVKYKSYILLLPVPSAKIHSYTTKPSQAIFGKKRWSTQN